MSRTVPKGIDYFERLRANNLFYLDKTIFIKDWWESEDFVTLITRPRSFGRSLLLDTVKTFFSPEFAEQSSLFEGLEIWQDEEFRNLQGTIPVVRFSLACIREQNYADAVTQIKICLGHAYYEASQCLDMSALSQEENELYRAVGQTMSDDAAKLALRKLCALIARQTYTLPIILVEEYDTPMQEAWLRGYWQELAQFLSELFVETFKENKWMERGLMTGISSIFADPAFSCLDNIKIVTTTSKSYADILGFTESEVKACMEEYDLKNDDDVEKWYGGYHFGGQKIYNPYSLIDFFSKKMLGDNWSQTIPSLFIGNIIGQSDGVIKEKYISLLLGSSVNVKLDENFTYPQANKSPEALWGLMLAYGYVTPHSFDSESQEYRIAVVNKDVHFSIREIVSNWFYTNNTNCEDFFSALFFDEPSYMDNALECIAKETYTFFDTTGNSPERFYLALIAEIIVKYYFEYEFYVEHYNDICMSYIVMISKKKKRNIAIMFAKASSNCEAISKDVWQKLQDKLVLLKGRGVSPSTIFCYGICCTNKKFKTTGGAQNQG
ncbi:MAG: AAA family ATPase [Desulfovibrionaceae bacterium]|nr:AAA family ATPase [Desulfovibrionaceae bacterium]